MLADRLVTQALDAITANTVSIGTGLIMLLAAGSLRDGSMTVGDFVLFISYLGFIADFTDGLGQYPGPLPADRRRVRAHGRLAGRRAADRAGGTHSAVSARPAARRAAAGPRPRPTG